MIAPRHASALRLRRGALPGTGSCRGGREKLSHCDGFASILRLGFGGVRELYDELDTAGMARRSADESMFKPFERKRVLNPRISAMCLGIVTEGLALQGRADNAARSELSWDHVPSPLTRRRIYILQITGRRSTSSSAVD